MGPGGGSLPPPLSSLMHSEAQLPQADVREPTTSIPGAISLCVGERESGGGGGEETDAVHSAGQDRQQEDKDEGGKDNETKSIFRVMVTSSGQTDGAYLKSVP